MNKYNLKSTAVLLQDHLDADRNVVYFQWYSLALYITESKIFKPTISKAKIKASNICEISFLNKNVVELINVPHISHDP